MVTIGAVPGDWVALRPVTKTTPGYFGTIMVYPLAQL